MKKVILGAVVVIFSSIALIDVLADPELRGDGEINISLTPLEEADPNERLPLLKDGESKTGYGVLVNGLRQHPYEYKCPEGYVVATECKARFNYDEDGLLKSLSYTFLTIEDEFVKLEINGDFLKLHDLKREIHAETGKYKFWRPVIFFKKKSRDGTNTYTCDEIDVIGRFFMKWGKPGTKDANTVLSYENEVYYR